MVALYLNEPKYWEFIRNLRNDPRVKKGFVKQKRISAKAHRKYMEKYNDRYYVCISDGELVGYIGDVDTDIRLAVVPERQGRGIGEYMLREYVKLRPFVRAKVKKDNAVSQRLFEKCGWRCTATGIKFCYYDL